MKAKLSIRALAKRTGADRASIAKWIDGITDEKQALAVIREHQGKTKRPAGAVDPKTGLTWFQAKLREDTLAKRRENTEKQREQDAKWMTVKDHHRILATLVDRLERLPGTLKSQLGLSDNQANQLRKALDDLRTEAADEVEKMF